MMKQIVQNTVVLFFLGMLFQMFLVINTYASNYVTVVTYGGQPYIADMDHGMQKMVDQVKAYWSNKLSVVLPNDPDIIVLAEHCDIPAGLSLKKRKEYTRVRGNQIRDFFSSIARKHHTYIAYGTYVFADNGKLYNSLEVLDRTGKRAGIYHKNFCTIGEIESGISVGSEAPLIQCDFGTVAGVICFDLNFSELRDRYVPLHPDIILFSSNYHGGYKQRDWAFTCRSFFIGAIGAQRPPSEIRNPQGDIVSSSGNYFNYAVATINLDRVTAHLDFNWEKLDALKKKYGKDVTITVPGSLGSVIITSEHDHINAAEMAEEFQIELLDDYFRRSREAVKRNLKTVD